MGVAGNGAADAAGIGVGRAAEGRSIWTTSLGILKLKTGAEPLLLVCC